MNMWYFILHLLYEYLVFCLSYVLLGFVNFNINTNKLKYCFSGDLNALEINPVCDLSAKLRICIFLWL